MLLLVYTLIGGDLMATEVALTTIENPYDPFEQSDAWLAYDMRLPCSATSFLAAYTSTVPSDLPQAVIEREIDAAIDRIIEDDPLGRFKKVVREVND